MKQANVLTGVTGFVGSHLAANLLLRPDAETLICLARSSSESSAKQRVIRAINLALRDQGSNQTLSSSDPSVVVLDVQLTDRGPFASEIGRVQRRYHIGSVWHCAASTKFDEAARRETWKSNIGGVKYALKLARHLGADSFNHISTAYASGCLTGRITETLHTRDGNFNNPYEESKTCGEHLVSEYCTRARLPYRIFRPSIVIGHSQTFRSMSRSGLYSAIELSASLCASVRRRDPDYFSHNVLQIACRRNATLHLIPIDVVVSEILEIVAAGRPSFDQIFHITNQNPVSAMDLFRAVLPVLGIRRIRLVPPETRLSGVDRRFNGMLRQFLPYLSHRKVFDRTNVVRLRADQQQMDLLIDAAEVERFMRSFLYGNDDEGAVHEIRDSTVLPAAGVVS